MTNDDLQNWYTKGSEGWHTYSLEYREGDNILLLEQKYVSMIMWILQNVSGAYRHARWKYSEEKITVKFRYERDYIMFMLSWS